MTRIVEFLFDVVVATALKIIGTVLVVTVLAQIFSRMFMANPYSWTDELARFSFLWFCFLAAGHALRMNAHLGLDYFYRKLNPKLRVRIDLFVQALTLFFGCLLLHFGIVMMTLTAIQKSPILRLQMSWMYAVLPTAGFLFVLHSVYQISLIWKARNTGSGA
jgi:TRAP-type C4-dicarboxylate transport system permease small subunit